jgi:Flp pilus assembly protein TadG
VFVKRKQNGASIAETAASLVLFLPILIAVLFVVLEASQAYLIKEGLSQAAREAARNLAVQYGSNSQIQYSRSMQDVMVFNNIHINNVVVSTNQFDSPTWDTAGIPPTVTVTVHYTSGKNGLSTFPNPDPLHIGKNFKLDATSTYRLE